jgi:SAM-dependent methyltransferase
MQRKDYWNRSYLEYWKSRVDEVVLPAKGSAIIAGDAVTVGADLYKQAFSQFLGEPGSLLDVGCAWGRMFGLFKSFGMKVSGIDISGAMIDQARADWEGDPSVSSLQECEAEEICFSEGEFDNVACLAVFDATFQHLALAEFIRVLRLDGLLFVTGKNDNYLPDDRMAVDAEVGARLKGHPNFFTDTPGMLEQLRAHGHRIEAAWFFERRGDFGAMKIEREMPPSFYEYFVVVRKKAPHGSFQPLSAAMSKTFSRIS